MTQSTRVKLALLSAIVIAFLSGAAGTTPPAGNVMYLPLIVHTGAQRGAAVLYYNQSGAADVDALGLDWWYSYWYQWKDGNTPMIRPDTLNAALAHFDATDYCGYVIFLNEPNVYTQDAVTPRQAAQMYRQVVTARPCLQIIAGNVWWNQFDGPGWWRAFHDEIEARALPLPTGYAMHYYDFTVLPVPHVAVDQAWGIVCGEWGECWAELWMPEFTVCNDADYLGYVLDELESRTYLTRYAYFATRDDGQWAQFCDWALIDDGGALTPLGLEYSR